MAKEKRPVKIKEGTESELKILRVLTPGDVVYSFGLNKVRAYQKADGLWYRKDTEKPLPDKLNSRLDDMYKQLKLVCKLSEVEIDSNGYGTMYFTEFEGSRKIRAIRNPFKTYWEDDERYQHSVIKIGGKGKLLESFFLYKMLGKITQRLTSLEESLSDDNIKNLSEQAKKDAEAIRAAANIVEKSKINFAQIYQDAETAGLEAITDIENIAEKADKRTEISTLYVEAYNSIEMKDYKSAFNIYKQVLKIDNNQPRALEGIAYIFEQQGLTEKADKWRRMAAELEAQGVE